MFRYILFSSTPRAGGACRQEHFVFGVVGRRNALFGRCTAAHSIKSWASLIVCVFCARVFSLLVSRHIHMLFRRLFSCLRWSQQTLPLSHPPTPTPWHARYSTKTCWTFWIYFIVCVSLLRLGCFVRGRIPSFLVLHGRDLPNKGCGVIINMLRKWGALLISLHNPRNAE